MFVGAVVAHPHGHRRLRRVGHGPDVAGAAVGLGHGAGLARHGHAAGGQGLGAAGGGGGLEHVGEDIGSFSADGARLLGLRLIHQAALSILDAADGVGADALAAVGQRAVGRAQLCGGDPVGETAQRHGQIGVLRGQRQAEALGVGAQGGRADLIGQGHRGDVQRARERLAQRHPAIAGPAGVAGGVAARKRPGRVVQEARGHVAVGVHGGGVGGHGLERRPRLAEHLRGAVQAPAHVVASAADHGADLAACRVQRHQRGLHGRAVVRCGGEVVAACKQRLRCALHALVEARVDAIAAGDHLVGAQAKRLRGLAQHRVHVPGKARVALVHGKAQRLRLRVRPLPVRDEAVFIHRVEDRVAPGNRAVRVQMRRVVRRRLDDPRQQRALGQREPGRGLVEIGVGGGLHAVGSVAEVHRVQIRLQNLALVHRLFQLQRQHDLLRLARQRLRLGQVRQLDQLLGDGGGPLGVAERADVVPKRAHQPVEVHAVVAVEAQVLGGDEGVLHVLGHARKRHPDAVLTALQRADGLAVRGKDRGRYRHPGDLLKIQLLPVGNVQPPDERRQRHQQRRADPREHFFLHQTIPFHVIRTKYSQRRLN